MSKARKTYTARAITALGATTVLWLTINIAADLAGAAVAAIDVAQLSALPAETRLDEWGGYPDPSGVSRWTGFARLPQIAVFLVTSLIALKWMYRASRNAQAFARGLVSTPPGAVYWYFVPVANLWKPFQAMSETWRISENPEHWKRAFAPDLLRWWWALWLIGTIAGNAAGRLGWRAVDVGSMQFATILEVVSDLVMAGTGFALIRIVRAITARQTVLIQRGWRRPERAAPEAWAAQGADEPF